MTPARWAGAAALAVVAAGGAWIAVGGLSATAPAPAPAPRAAAPAPARAVQPIETVDAAPTTAGETPMAQRVAVIGFLNKRNGEARELVMKPGQAYRVGDAIVRLRACEKTAPWEQDVLTGAFLQLDVQSPDKRWRRAFSGWVFKERPSLNVVEHAVYDVWPKSCTMRFPATGPDTETLSSGAAPSSSRSRASNAPRTSAEPESSPAASEPSAEPSNAL
jgi:hypothetical protein